MKLFNEKPDGTGLGEVMLEPFDREGLLESWIQANPSELIGLAGETLLTVGCQTQTDYGPLDVLCLDVHMNPVVVELKRERAPRDVIAQALEYTTWVSRIDYDKLARMAAEYLKRPLAEAYWEAFGDDLLADDETTSQRGMRADEALKQLFDSSRPRVFIVAGEIPERTGAVADFLRRRGLDISCLEVKRSAGTGQMLLAVDAVVGGGQPEAAWASQADSGLEQALQTEEARAA